MPDPEFRNASVLLFDPVGPNLASTRSVLLQIGFIRVEATREFTSLSRKLADSAFDLALLEVTDAGGDVCGLVRRLRAGEIGHNPFTVVMLTSWGRTTSEVSPVIDTGSDDVLLRPFSPNMLQARIQAFTRRRKPFVVTGSYIGPDRRQDAARPSDAQFIEPPNTLKAAVEGDRDALMRHQEAVSAAADAVDRQRLRRLALRIAAAGHIRLSGREDREGGNFEELAEAADELRRRLERHAKAEAIEIAETLCGVLVRIREDDAAGQDQLELLRDLPMGVIAALEGETAAVRAREEIQAVLTRIRARFAEVPSAVAS